LPAGVAATAGGVRTAPPARAEEGADVPGPALAATGRALRVLIIEDEPTVARLIDDVLRQDGFATETALGGQDGLHRLLASRAQPFDLVICDLKMPGLDGPGLYRELVGRNHPARDRMLFITGDTLSRRTLEFVKQNKVPFLAKPFLADELRLTIERCLGGSVRARPKGEL